MHPKRVDLFNAILLAVGDIPIDRDWNVRADYWRKVIDMIESYLDEYGVYGTHRMYLEGGLRRAYVKWLDRERARRRNNE